MNRRDAIKLGIGGAGAIMAGGLPAIVGKAGAGDLMVRTKAADIATAFVVNHLVPDRDGGFALARLLYGTPEQGPSLLGRANAAPFLGFGAGTVIFDAIWLYQEMVELPPESDPKTGILWRCRRFGDWSTFYYRFKHREGGWEGHPEAKGGPMDFDALFPGGLQSQDVHERVEIGRGRLLAKPGALIARIA